MRLITPLSLVPFLAVTFGACSDSNSDEPASSGIPAAGGNAAQGGAPEPTNNGGAMSGENGGTASAGKNSGGADPGSDGGNNAGGDNNAENNAGGNSNGAGGDNSAGGDNAGGESNGGNNAGGEASGGSNAGGDPNMPGVDPWSNCPTFADYQPQNGWNNVIQITNNARYCAHDSNEFELKTKLANKAIMRFAAGEYKIPADLESQAVTLPACVLKAGASKAVAIAVKLTNFQKPPNGTYEVVGIERGLDGGFHTDVFGRARTYITLQDGDRQHIFDSCEYTEIPIEKKPVSFEGGSLTFDVRWVSGSAGFGAGVLLRAQGTYKGQNVDQKEFFKLGVIGLRHFYVGSAVVFDAPIDGVCALEFTSVNYSDPDRAVAWNCDYSKSTNVPLN